MEILSAIGTRIIEVSPVEIIKNVGLGGTNRRPADL